MSILSPDLKQALLRVKMAPILVMPGIVMAFVGGGIKPAIGVFCAVYAVIGFALIVAMLLPSRGCMTSLGERFAEIKRGKAKI